MKVFIIDTNILCVYLKVPYMDDAGPANEEEPWAAFTFQSELWNEENLLKLADEWPGLAVQKLSIGDTTIKNVAKYYSDAGYQVEILTADQGLKSYEPATTNVIPRRRKR